MDAETAARLAQLDQFEAKKHAAIDALAAVSEAPELDGYTPRRTALLDALNWLEISATCGDCIEGRCHYGGERSRASIAAAEAGHEYVDPEFGPGGCARHGISVEARQRRARMKAAALLS